MIWWSLIFLLAAIVAAIFAYGEIVVGAESIAKALFWIFIILFLACVIFYSYTVPFDYTNYSVP
jgi:uncharacterized membrane protein YtjA (UPF0391 family)